MTENPEAPFYGGVRELGGGWEKRDMTASSRLEKTGLASSSYISYDLWNLN